MTIVQTLVSDGEQFSAEMRKSLFELISILHGDVDLNENVTRMKLNGAFEHIKLWKYRSTFLRRPGERTGLSGKYAEPVYEALDVAFERVARVIPGLRNVSAEDFADDILATLQRITIKCELEKKKDAFLASLPKCTDLETNVTFTWTTNTIETEALQTFLHEGIDALSGVPISALTYE